MSARKTDLVRRSLFGSGDAQQEDTTGRPRPRRGQQQAGRASKTSRPREGEAVNEPLPTNEGRRQVERTAVTVPSELLLRVKDAVAVLNGWPQQYTMARFVEEAFSAQLERLKVEHNGGREFPITNRKIRTGRPPGS